MSGDEHGVGAALYDAAVELVRLRAVVAEQRERISGLLDLGERYARADGAKREALQAIYDLPGGRQDEAWRIAYRALALDAEGVSEPEGKVKPRDCPGPSEGGSEDSAHEKPLSVPGSLTSPVDTGGYCKHGIVGTACNDCYPPHPSRLRATSPVDTTRKICPNWPVRPGCECRHCTGRCLCEVPA